MLSSAKPTKRIIHAGTSHPLPPHLPRQLSLSLDAAELLGPGCQRRLIDGCTYSTERLNEVAHKKVPELAGQKRWRFMITAA